MTNIGRGMSDLNFWTASFLPRPGALGLVSIGLMVALLLVIVHSLISARRKLSLRNSVRLSHEHDCETALTGK